MRIFVIAKCLKTQGRLDLLFCNLQFTHIVTHYVMARDIVTSSMVHVQCTQYTPVKIQYDCHTIMYTAQHSTHTHQSFYLSI